VRQGKPWYDASTSLAPVLTNEPRLVPARASGAGTERCAVTEKRGNASRAALIEAARALALRLYGPAEQLTRITIRLQSGIRIRVDVPAGPLPEPFPEQPAAEPAGRFVPTPFQKGILQALHGQALRTDDLARKVGNRRKLFIHPGGLRELQEHGLVAHHKRLGYFRPDAPPPALRDDAESPGESA
jgi:hypothetical protein